MGKTFFDLGLSAASAYNQIMYLIGALFCLAIGGLLLGNGLYWRLHAEKVTGTIAGVRNKGGFFYVVYRYTLANGQSYEATSDTGSGAMPNVKTGQPVSLHVFASHPEQARPSGNCILEIFGLILLAPGFLFLYLGLSSFHATPMTFVMLGAFALYGFIHLHGIILPKDKRMPISQWKEMMLEKHKDEMQAIPIQSVETVESLPDQQQSLAAQTKSRRQVRVVLLLFAPCLLALGIYLGNQTATLVRDGLRAPGTVVSLTGEWTSGTNRSYVYHAMVDFAARDGHKVEFKDKTGSSPPLYSAGDNVTVLYLESEPEKSATIDHGIWNWVAPVLLSGIGALLFLLGLSMFRKQNT